MLDLYIDALMPTLIIGDFNTHSPSWSPPDTTWSNWARKVEEWAAKNLLTLTNTPGEVTHKGADHEHDSVIDLAWYNVVIQANPFTNLKIDWEGSLGSNNVLLQVLASLGPTCHPPPSDANLGFMINPDLKGDWIKTFKAYAPPLLIPFSPTTEEVEQAVAGLISDIQGTNKNIFCRRCPFHPEVAPWWDSACTIAAQKPLLSKVHCYQSCHISLPQRHSLCSQVQLG